VTQTVNPVQSLLRDALPALIALSH